MTFVEDPADLVEEVVDDLFVRRFHRHGDPQFSRAEALRIARIAVENPAARIEPDGAPENSIAAMRVRFARVVCEEFERRKRRMSLITYEDLLTRLKDTLAGPGRRGRGGAAARALPGRARRRVPGHRSGPVGHHAPRVRGRRRRARADRRPETGDLRLPRGRRLRVPEGAVDGEHGGDARGQLAQRPGADRRVRRAVRRRDARAQGDRLPAGARGAFESAAGADRRAGGRAGAGAGRAPRRAVDHAHALGLRAGGVGARAHRVRSGGRLGRAAVVAARRSRSGGRGRGRAASPRAGLRRPRRGARAHAPQRRAGARRAGSRRHPGGHQRRGQRVRHRPGARLAARAGGDRAAGFLGSCAVGRADPVPRLDGCACGGRRRGGVGGGAPAAASLGAGAAHERRRGADGDGDARGGPARPGAGDGRRRACR